MNKNYLRVFISTASLFFLTTTTSFSQEWQWAKRGGSVDAIPTGLGMMNEQVTSMATDDQGNVFALSPVGVSLINVDGLDKEGYSSYNGAGEANIDYMISSFACDGTLRWAKVMGGPSSDFFTQLKTDVAGNVYTAGTLYNLQGGGLQDVHIDEDMVIPFVNSDTNSQSMYLVKYSNDGELLWVRTPEVSNINLVESITNNRSLSVDVDPQGNTYWLCRLKSGTYGGTYTVTTPGTSLHILTYNAAGEFTGGHPMALQYQGTPVYFTKMVRNHTNGTLYVAGYNFTFDETDAITINGVDTDKTAYVAAFDAEGDWLWTTTNSLTTPAAFLKDVTLDTAGNIYITGTSINGDAFGGQALTSAQPFVFPFIAKLNTAGVVQWVSNAATQASIDGQAVIVNGDEVAVTGGANGMQWGNYTIPLVLNVGYDIFVTRFNKETGVVLGMDTVNSITGGYDYGTALAVSHGNYYVGAEFAKGLIVNGETIQMTGVESDFAVIKYGNDCCLFLSPDFSFEATEGQNMGITFTYTGEDGYDTIAWDFGDGNTSAQASPNHIFDAAGTHTVCVTVSNGCGSQEYCTEVEVASLGIKNQQLSQVQTYPNPVQNVLNIQSAQELSYALYSVLGTQVASGSIAAGTSQLKLEEFASGIYMLTLKNNLGEQKTIKVVKE